MLCEVNHGSLCGVLHSLFLSLLREHVPQLVHIGGGAVVLITLQVKVSNTDLSEVSRVATRKSDNEKQGLTTYRKEYADGADLQPYHVQKDGNDACLKITKNENIATNTTVSGTDMTSGLSVLAKSARLHKGVRSTNNGNHHTKKGSALPSNHEIHYTMHIPFYIQVKPIIVDVAHQLGGVQ